MGHLDLYHRTSPDAAAAILRTKRMDSKERGDVFFSTHRDGDNAGGYGSAVVHVRVPEHLAELDDEFPDGEQHYRVRNRDLQAHHFVGIRALADAAPEKDAHRLQFSDPDEQDSGGSKWPNQGNIRAHHPDHGQVGSVQYLRGSRANSPIMIKMLQVHPDHQRKGYGSALMDKLQETFPKAKINHGDRTDAGKGWWDSYGRGRADRRGRTSALAAPWATLHVAVPTRRIFGPTFGLDKRLFDGDALKADVSHYILSTLDGFWRPIYGPGWMRWARVYFAGSEASEWTSKTLEGNNDFDVLIGIHYDRMRESLGGLIAMMSNEQITNALNTQFRELAARTDPVWILVKDGVNSGSWENQGGSPADRPRSTTSLPASTSRRAGQPAPSDGTSASRSAPSATTWSDEGSSATRLGARTAPGGPLARSAAPAVSGWTPPTPTQLPPGARDSVPSATRPGTGTTTWSAPSASQPSDSTSYSPSRAVDAGGVDAPTSSSSSTTTGDAAPAASRVGSASEASSAPGTTRRLASSKSVIWAPQSTGLTEESLPSPPDGYRWVGPLSNTWYCNPDSWDIRDIKPYAAYDVTNHRWAVRPPHLPDWSIEKFPEGHAMVEMGEAYEKLIKAIFDLPEPYRTQQGNALWTYLHTDRSRAFGPEGEGWYDPGNVMEKWTDQQGLWKDLWAIHHRADEDPSTLLAPADWSNDPGAR